MIDPRRSPVAGLGSPRHSTTEAKESKQTERPKPKKAASKKRSNKSPHTIMVHRAKGGFIASHWHDENPDGSFPEGEDHVLFSHPELAAHFERYMPLEDESINEEAGDEK